MMLMQNEETNGKVLCSLFLGKNHLGINYFLYNFCLKAIDRRIRTNTQNLKKIWIQQLGIKRYTIIMSTNAKSIILIDFTLSFIPDFVAEGQTFSLFLTPFVYLLCVFVSLSFSQSPHSLIPVKLMIRLVHTFVSVTPKKKKGKINHYCSRKNNNFFFVNINKSTGFDLGLERRQ